MHKRYYVIGFNPWAVQDTDGDKPRDWVFAWDEEGKQWMAYSNMSHGFLGLKEHPTDEMMEKLKTWCTPTCVIRIEEAYCPSDEDIEAYLLKTIKLAKLAFTGRVINNPKL